LLAIVYHLCTKVKQGDDLIQVVIFLGKEKIAGQRKDSLSDMQQINRLF
jgi:hypothetical protein